MKKNTKYEVIKKLSLKASLPLTEKIQETTSKCVYVRKKLDLSEFSQEKKNIFRLKYESMLKLQSPLIIPFISCEWEGDVLITIRDYQPNNLREFLINKFEKLDRKTQRSFLKNLFFSLIEAVFILTDANESKNIANNVNPKVNLKLENILIDSKQRVYLVDSLIIDTNSNNQNKKNNDVFKLSLITLFAITKGHETPELLAQVTLCKNKDNVPKSLYPLLFICLVSEPIFQPLLSFLYKIVLSQRKTMALKLKAKEKEADNNELFILRRAVVDQGQDLNLLEERLNEKKEMMKEAGDYFLAIEKGLFQKTVDENWLVVKNRILESQLKESLRNQEKSQNDNIKNINEVSSFLRKTQDDSIKMIMKMGSKDFEQENECFYKAMSLKGHVGAVNSLHFFENPMDFRPKILSVSADQSLIQWDLLNLAQEFQIPNAHKGPINIVSLNSETNLAYTGSDDNSVKIWDLSQKKCKDSLYGSKGAIHEIQPLIKTQQLVFAGVDPRIFIYNENKGKMSGVIKGHQATIWNLKRLYDDTVLASVSSDKTVKMWDFETRNCMQTFLGHERDILAIDSLLDEKLLMTGGLDETIRLWDPISGECVNLIYEGLKTIRALIGIRNQGMFACLSESTVSFYDVRKMKRIGEINEEKRVGGIGFMERVGLLGYGVGGEIRICAEY